MFVARNLTRLPIRRWIKPNVLRRPFVATSMIRYSQPKRFVHLEPLKQSKEEEEKSKTEDDKMPLWIKLALAGSLIGGVIGGVTSVVNEADAFETVFSIGGGLFLGFISGGLFPTIGSAFVVVGSIYIISYPIGILCRRYIKPRS